MIMTYGSHISVMVQGRKEEQMKEREGQPGHFACLDDLESRWTVELACHASKSGNTVCIFSLRC
jgi:hypothetical protein